MLGKRALGGRIGGLERVQGQRRRAVRAAPLGTDPRIDHRESQWGQRNGGRLERLRGRHQPSGKGSATLAQRGNSDRIRE